VTVFAWPSIRSLGRSFRLTAEVKTEVKLPWMDLIDFIIIRLALTFFVFPTFMKIITMDFFRLQLTLKDFKNFTLGKYTFQEFQSLRKEKNFLKLYLR